MATDPKADTVLDHHMGRLRLLIAEDNDGDARKLQTMLVEAFGQDAVLIRARSLEEALKLTGDAEPFDFVLLDLGLPDCKGLEVFRRFAPAVPLATAIIVMSTHEDEALGVGALQEGAQDYLVKSRLATYSLAHAIRNAWERQRSRARIGDLAALLDITQDAIIVCDMLGLVTYWSHGAQALFGWSPEEARGCAVGSLLRLSSDKSMSEVFRTVLESGEWRGELRFVNTQGCGVLTDCRWSVVCDHHGNPSSYLCVCTDITNLRQVEQRQTTAVLSGIGAALAAAEVEFAALRTALAQSSHVQALDAAEAAVRKAVALLRDAGGGQPAAVAPETASGAADAAQEDFTGRGELILVVDDEEYIRELLRAMLEARGYKILTAAGGIEAVRMYRANQIDIRAVVVDMMMPGMDGEAVMREIRQFAPDARFISVSGVPTKAIPSDKADQLFLSKPFSRRQLLSALRQTLDRPA